MSKIEIPESEVWDAIEAGEVVDVEPWKWGTTQTIVTPFEGKHYRFSVQFHHDDGLQVYGPVKAIEVHQVEKTVRVWEPVPCAANGEVKP